MIRAEDLARVELFAELDADSRGELARHARGRRYPKGAAIYLPGDASTNVHVVLTGWVKLVVAEHCGRELVLDLVGPGRLFGELAALEGWERRMTAVAHQDCRVLLLPHDAFIRFLDAHPAAARSLLAVQGRHLRRVIGLLREALLGDPASRIQYTLLRLAEAQDRHAEPGQPLDVRVTQEDLAFLLGVSRETVNAWLRGLEARGRLQRHRGRITLMPV